MNDVFQQNIDRQSDINFRDSFCMCFFLTRSSPISTLHLNALFVNFITRDDPIIPLSGIDSDILVNHLLSDMIVNV